MTSKATSEEERFRRAIVQFNGRIMGMLLGLIFGLGVFVATNWLVLKGGYWTPEGEYVVGPHMQLLGQYFIGYQVTFFGSFVGLAYGFVVGYLLGIVVAWIYNRMVRLASRG